MDNESDGSSDGPVLYRDDDETDNTYGELHYGRGQVFKVVKD